MQGWTRSVNKDRQSLSLFNSGRKLLKNNYYDDDDYAYLMHKNVFDFDVIYLTVSSCKQPLISFFRCENA